MIAIDGFNFIEREGGADYLHFISMWNTGENVFVNSLQQGKLEKCRVLWAFSLLLLPLFSRSYHRFFQTCLQKNNENQNLPSIQWNFNICEPNTFAVESFGFNLFSSPEICPYFSPTLERERLLIIKISFIISFCLQNK